MTAFILLLWASLVATNRQFLTSNELVKLKILKIEKNNFYINHLSFRSDSICAIHQCDDQ